MFPCLVSHVGVLFIDSPAALKSDATLHTTLADAYKDGDNLDGAVQEYSVSVRLQHNNSNAHTLCNMMFTLQTACYWRHELWDPERLWRMVRDTQLDHGVCVLAFRPFICAVLLSERRCCLLQCAIAIKLILIDVAGRRA